MKKYLLGSVYCLLAAMLVADVALAEEVANAGGNGLLGIAAGLGMGLAAGCAAFGIGKLMSSALEGISRNPAAAAKMFIPWLVGLVFVEVTVILTFVVASGIAGKI